MVSFERQYTAPVLKEDPHAPAVATAQNGQAVHAYVANSNRGTWLFQADPNGGGGNQG